MRKHQEEGNFPCYPVNNLRVNEMQWGKKAQAVMPAREKNGILVSGDSRKWCCKTRNRPEVERALDRQKPGKKAQYLWGVYLPKVKSYLCVSIRGVEKGGS